VHALQCANAFVWSGTRPGRERSLGRCDGTLSVQCIAQPNLTNDFLSARVMQVEPFLTVWNDVLAVDVDVFNALRGDSSLKMTRLNRASLKRSLIRTDYSDKLPFG